MSQITRHHSASSFQLDKEKEETEISQHVALEDMHLVHMSMEERTAAFALARELDPGPPVFSWRYLNFFMSIVVVLVCSCDSGFDSTIMSSVNSMTQFQDYFGLISASTGTGILFGVYTVGSVCSFFPNIILPDLLGRRVCMIIGNSLLMTGAIISANAKDMPMLLGGRWLTGFGCTMGVLSSKLYMAEITPATSRGRYMGFLNSFFFVGQIAATAAAIPLGRLTSEWSWRTCLYLQCGPAVVNILGVPWIAESPRWLYARGHAERARAILAKYHSRTGDVNSPVIKLEMQEIEAAISLEGGDRQFWNFKKVFGTRADRYRFGLCLMISVWGQLAGNSLITYFLPVLLGLAGIENRDTQRQLNLVNSVTSMCGAIAGSSAVDHIGRRKLLLSAITGACCGMFLVGALNSPAGVQSKTRADAGISFIFLFGVFYSFGMTPLQGLYPSEVLSFENRAKGLSLQAWFTNAIACINTFAIPPALGKLGYIVYFMFGAWNLIGIAVIYTFAVETKQLSLEEMSEVFDAPRPKLRSFELAAVARERVKKEKELLRARE
ncbi:general substrate transporter [Dioszegia hungarica]|uniref:General substrate transporter n=1 Tax=Dioszegia hungarica TaxID=4972 RepID=A0AA38LRI8_9TREE|nr:general substrate transporter [Dioszegia hungarica]KAI9633105.1 general substrate transporter [Dioszegia hungarica]